MAPSAQEPRRKKTKRPSMQDYAVVDRPYRAPHDGHFTPEDSGSEKSHPLRRKQKHGKSNAKSSAVRRPKNKNAKDPFDCLVDDVVGIIVFLLPVQATETLRRVSKLWKATSEYHNDTRAIRRHFFHLGEAFKSFDSREEANLHFRRLLYHQESLKAGFATRALQCSGTEFWRLSNGTLMWASSSGSVSLRRLRSQDCCRSVNEEAKELDLHGTWPSLRRTLDVSLTNAGEILTHIDSTPIDSTPDEPAPSYTTWAKLLKDGTIVWKVDIPGWSYYKTIRATVSESYVYTIEEEQPMGHHMPGQYIERQLVVRSLLDGGIVHQRLVPPLDDGPEDLQGDLQITSDEGWALFKKDCDVYVFATTGSNHASRVAIACCGTPVRSKVANQVWVVDYNFSSSTRSVLLTPDYEKPVADAMFMTDRYFRYTRHPDRCGVGFDPDMLLLFRMLKDPLPVVHVIKMTRDKECVHKFNNVEELRDTLVEGHGRTVTLPALPADKPGGSRRDLNILLPWTTQDSDYFGIVDDYVVYHSVEDEMLLVLDFWPVW